MLISEVSIGEVVGRISGVDSSAAITEIVVEVDVDTLIAVVIVMKVAVMVVVVVLDALRYVVLVR